jgi:phosphoribosyl transferase, competence protein
MSILFPQNLYCISCGEPISIKNHMSMCKKCYVKIEFLYNKNISYDVEVMKILEKKYINNVYMVTVYNDVIKKLIHDIKYNNKTYLAEYFSQILYDCILDKSIEFDYISYVPLHKKRYMYRGYNQVKLICEHLEKMLNKKVVDVSKRIKNTKSLFELSLADRENEMKNAFESIHLDILENKTLLLVDDILTTGATIKNLSENIHKSNKNTKINLLFLSRSSIK